MNDRHFFDLVSLPSIEQPKIASYRENWAELHLFFHQQSVLCDLNYLNCFALPLSIDKARSSTTEDCTIYGVSFYTAESRDRDCQTEFFQLFVEASLLSRIREDLYLKNTLSLTPKLIARDDPLIARVAFATKQYLETDRSQDKLDAESIANTLAVHLLVRYSQVLPVLPQQSGGLSEEQLRIVIDYIHSYFDRELSLAELAKLTRLSIYHFTRSFKQSVGLTPHQYHIHYRIDRAKQMLLEGKLNFADIAATVGFASQSHFNYHFKRLLGKTPKEFLQQK